MNKFTATIEYENGNIEEVIIKKCKNIGDAMVKMNEKLDMKIVRSIIIRKPSAFITIEEDTVETECENTLWGVTKW